MITRKRCPLCNHENRESLESELENLIITTDELDEQMNWPSGTSSKHQRNHMEGFVNSSNPRCSICVSPDRAEIEMKLYEAQVTPAEVAHALNCSEAQVMRHLTKHLQPIVQQSAANMIAIKEVDEIDTLSNNIGRLEGKIDELFLETDLNPKYIDSLTKLAKEIRESLKYLMEFKGKLVHKRQDTIIVAQMQIVQEVLAQNHPQVWLDIKNKMQEKLQ